MRRKAFTLVELLVVIAIIGLLTSVAVVSTSSAAVKARNQKRKADLVQISKALDLYYTHYGSYPLSGGWWIGQGSSFGGRGDVDPGSWIPGLISGGYMAKLPRDPLAGKSNPNSTLSTCQEAFGATLSGYIYWSNGDDYKVAADCLPEGPIPTTDPFYDPVSAVGQAYSVWTPGARTWW